MGEEADAMWLWEMDRQGAEQFGIEGAERFGANVPPGVFRGDWHEAANSTEPRCGADQWRTKDREEILYMHEMHDRHLGHCIRFAKTKPQHRSRLAGLLAEQARRRTQ